MDYIKFKNSIRREDQKRNDTNHWFSSRFAPRISYIAYRLGITGDQMTIVFFLTGVLSAFAYRIPNLHGVVIGYILFRLHIIFDMCDGNLARVNRSFSKRGIYWDSMAHNIINPLIVMNLTHAIFLWSNDIRFYYIQGPLVLIIALTSAVKNNYYKALYNSKPSDKVIEREERNTLKKFIIYIISEMVGMEGLILFSIIFYLFNFKLDLGLIILTCFAIGNSSLIAIKFYLFSYKNQKVNKI